MRTSVIFTIIFGVNLLLFQVNAQSRRGTEMKEQKQALLERIEDIDSMTSKATESILTSQKFLDYVENSLRVNLPADSSKSDLKELYEVVIHDLDAIQVQLWKMSFFHDRLEKILLFEAFCKKVA